MLILLFVSNYINVKVHKVIEKLKSEKRDKVYILNLGYL